MPDHDPWNSRTHTTAPASNARHGVMAASQLPSPGKRTLVESLAPQSSSEPNTASRPSPAGSSSPDADGARGVIQRKCDACGAPSDKLGACDSCAAGDSEKASLSPGGPETVSGGASARAVAGAPQPKSLHQTLAPVALSDEAILAEIEAIRAWFDAQAASSKDSEELARALGLLAHEFVARHPKAAFSTTAPRPVSSVTPSEVRQASAIALSGLVGAGALMAMPGLPPPVSMPPPVPLSPLPPIGPVAPPIAAPPPPGPVTSPPVAPAPRPAPVPVPPIAAGALAFLAVMLWPRNTIESGEEERRKLEEYERRRRSASNPHPAGPSATTSTASTPTPAPAPGPTPVPPLGTGPNERRLPNQTCENQLLDMLQKAMHDVCDRIPGESCSPKKVSPKKLARRPCSQVRQRIQAVRECMRLRQNIQDQCFGGVADQKHADVLTELQSGLAACLALEAVNCAPGHPMAEL